VCSSDLGANGRSNARPNERTNDDDHEDRETFLAVGPRTGFNHQKGFGSFEQFQRKKPNQRFVPPEVMQDIQV